MPSPLRRSRMKPLTTEESGSEVAAEGDVDLRAEGRAQRNASFWAQDGPAESSQIDWQDRAGELGGEGDDLLGTTLVCEVREEDRLLRHCPLAGVLDPAPQPLIRLGAVPHLRLEADVGFEEHHRSGLADNRLAWV